MSARLRFTGLLVGASLAALSGCLGTELSEVDCPDEGTTLTYEGFGKGFFASYCVECHGGTNAYSGRSYTTVEAIRADAERIFINAAADNTFMPPGPDDPNATQREALAEWLACGAP